MLGYADLSLFAFFSVVYCLTWFVVSSERKKGGERNCSELVSPPTRADRFRRQGGGLVQMSRAHVRVHAHLHTRTRAHTRAPVGAPGNTQVAAAAGCGRGCQRLQTLFSNWTYGNSLTLCNQPLTRNRKAGKSAGGAGRGCS